jgi:hypothetical protein
LLAGTGCGDQSGKRDRTILAVLVGLGSATTMQRLTLANFQQGNARFQFDFKISRIAFARQSLLHVTNSLSKVAFLCKIVGKIAIELMLLNAVNVVF